MDEPTNHMDIYATLALEEALADYPGAIVLVSHDARFVTRLTTARWEVQVLDSVDSQLRVL
jgi:ATPase subunit of ABC transporter with duplicated ATPase domains